jgi:putative YhbY family RNA-binding protein
VTALLLSPAERKQKRADAHHLNPVVAIGADGATEAVRRELDTALGVHGLVKVRVFSDDRAAREALFGELSAALDAAPVQHIGKLLVFWREPRPKEKAEGRQGPEVLEERQPPAAGQEGQGPGQYAPCGRRRAEARPKARHQRQEAAAGLSVRPAAVP